MCTRCLRPRLIHVRLRPDRDIRNASSSEAPPRSVSEHVEEEPPEEKPQGAMSRRLEQMTEENIQTGSRSARKAVEEGGFEFSETLKKELEDKIANATFRSDHASAFAQANMPSGAGKFERELAAARPWGGTESVEDASLRMLNDAHRPLRGTQRTTVRTPKKVDTGRPKEKANVGIKLANAKERSSLYSYANDEAQGLTEEEREKFRREMKARFQPGARAVPATVTGLAALANERIEDAIARGKFKNLPRGKKIERDYNASSPFIDTTEYFLNGMIKKQDIVPPWIEKQQEVASAASAFRKRLRNDWKRHVARSVIVSCPRIDNPRVM